MQTNIADPPTALAAGILDARATLIPLDPLLTANLTSTNPAARNLWLPLRTDLPPLSFLLLADRLAELYEMVFPDRPDWLTDELVHWRDEEDVAAAVARFLRRVNTLFPVHDDIWDVDLEVIEWRLHEIPVLPMGFDEWYDGWDELTEPAPYLLHLCYSRDEADNLHGHDEFADLYPAHQLPRCLDPHCLVETLRRMGLPEPLNALPDLLLMLDHATGNVWLDVGEIALAEGGGYPQWQPDEVAWLAAAWQKAQPILDRIDRLLAWQNNTPATISDKLTAVRDALLAAHHRAQQTAETAVFP